MCYLALLKGQLKPGETIQHNLACALLISRFVTVLQREAALGILRAMEQLCTLISIFIKVYVTYYYK